MEAGENHPWCRPVLREGKSFGIHHLPFLHSSFLVLMLMLMPKIGIYGDNLEPYEQVSRRHLLRPLKQQPQATPIVLSVSSNPLRQDSTSRGSLIPQTPPPRTVS